MGSVKDWAKRVFGRWLNMVEAVDSTITINMSSSHEVNVMKNRIWYRGDPSEIEQFFKAAALDEVRKARFWASSPSKGLTVRKWHSGLPGMIVNVLADIVVTDLLDVEFKQDIANIDEQAVWAEIAKENGLNRLLAKAIQEVLVTGDGAFKLSIDTDLSDYPILEFYAGERVDYTFNRGRIQEVQFLTRYDEDGKQFTLVERYGAGYLRYELLNQAGDPVPLAYVPDLAGLADVTWEGNYMMALPMMFYQSPIFEGRGRSIYDLKTDAFDALDETISQWQDAVRLGRIKRYIPKSLIPYDQETGKPLPVNPLDNQFTALADPMNENGQSRIMTEQPAIQYEGYVNTYINNLDLCLQGIISPSTLGIDTKKLDNAEAQREKEKTTLYTRQKIIDVLYEMLPKLVEVSIRAYATLENINIPDDITCTVEFGEYANPSFEAQVETIGKAAAHMIMSIEAQVNSLWGDTKDEDWLEDEIRRIKAEKGIMEAEEPSMLPHGFIDGLGLDREEPEGEEPPEAEPEEDEIPEELEA